MKNSQRSGFVVAEKEDRSNIPEIRQDILGYTNSDDDLLALLQNPETEEAVALEVLSLFWNRYDNLIQTVIRTQGVHWSDIENVHSDTYCAVMEHFR